MISMKTNSPRNMRQVMAPEIFDMGLSRNEFLMGIQKNCEENITFNMAITNNEHNLAPLNARVTNKKNKKILLH